MTPPRPALLIATVVLVGVSLRGPLIAIAPVTGQVRHGLHIGAATAGLFTSIPVLLFAAAAPPALFLLVRAGLDRVVLYALLGVALGTFVRSVGGLPVALAGTAVLGLAIGVGNVAIPVAIGRDFPGRGGPITGLYTASLNTGAMLTSLLTAPLAAAVGWRWALAGWGLLGLAAAALWRWVIARATANGTAAADDNAATGTHAVTGTHADTDADTGTHADTDLDAVTDGGSRAPMWRRPAAVLLTLAFGCQAFSYYGITAWLPSLLADERGLSRTGAGLSSSLFQILGIVGAVGVPALVHRGVARRTVLIGVCVCFLILPLGLIADSAWWSVWCSFGGLAQGGGITVIFILVLAQAHGVADRQRLSTLVQGGGYAVGATGPTVIGAVHQLSGSWRAPMLVIVAVLIAMLVAGAIAAANTARSVQVTLPV